MFLRVLKADKALRDGYETTAMAQRFLETGNSKPTVLIHSTMNPTPPLPAEGVQVQLRPLDISAKKVGDEPHYSIMIQLWDFLVNGNQLLALETAFPGSSCSPGSIS